MSITIPENIPEDMLREIKNRGGMEKILDSLPSDKSLDEMAKVHHALSDILRLKIICLLRIQRLCVCLIRAFVNIPYSKLSYHLSILKDAGIIAGERRGNYIIYSLTRKGKKIADEICKTK